MPTMDDSIILEPRGKLMSVQAPVQGMTVTVDHIWIALADGGVEVRHGRTAELVHYFQSAPRPTAVTRIWTLLAVPTGAKSSQVWMGLSSGAIEVYDAKNFLMLRQLNKHAGGVYCLAEFGGFVYSGSSDFQIAQWCAEDGRFVRIFRGHKSYVRCLYAEGSAVVSGSDDCTVRVWDVGSGETQLKGYFHGRAGVSTLCRVGVTMWSGDNEGRVVAWKLGTCEALRVFQAHEGRAMSLRKIGSRVYSGGADGVIAVFDAEDGQLVQRVADRNGVAVNTLLGTAELRRFCIWSCGTDNIIRCWYQDEYVRMTGDQERFADDFWYQAGSTSYREFRESMKAENNNLCETLLAAQQQNTRMLELLGVSSSTLSPEHTQEQELKLEKEYKRVKELQVIVQSELQKSKEELGQIQKETGTVLELLRLAQEELRALDPTALSQIMTSGGAYYGNAGQPVATTSSFTPTAIPGPLLSSSVVQPLTTSLTGIPPPPQATLPTATGTAPTSAGLPPSAAVFQPQVGVPSTGIPQPLTRTLESGPTLSTAGIGTSQPGVQVSKAGMPFLAPGVMPSSAPLAVIMSGTQPLASGVAGAVVEGKGDWKGVEWTNKNVGCYIQRRYYGAEPSLRTPALEKRRLSQGRLPDVKLEPRTTKSKKIDPKE